MKFNTPDTGYWDRKFIAFMHDPLDKIFQIQGHEKRAAEFIEKYGLQKTNDDFWKKADAIAAGFERGQVPSYSADPDKNGAVDFIKHPVITHPTSEKAQLEIKLPGSDQKTKERIFQELLEFMEKDIGVKPGHGGYSDKFKGDEDRFAIARFYYTHLVLRFKLAENNTGGLGGFWHRIPADSRFPDHSIWQHNALCSALCSCIELAGDESEIGMMVFSITPVQAFISKARKLRDYWTGSVLLSWLAFEGMRWVIENLGPDHIVYPSLIDQPLVNEYLKQKWKIDNEGFLNPPKDIASFPNKFVFLVPMKFAEDIGEKIKSHINSAWKIFYEKICSATTKMLKDFLNEEQKEFIKEIFERQNEMFWDMQWSAAYLVRKNDRSEIEKLLSENIYKNSFELGERFNKIIEDKPYYDKSGRGALYSVTHSLVQAALASSKNTKVVTRLPETGEKCHLCGEFEVLHHIKYNKDISAGEYKNNVKDFWRHLKQHWDGDEGQDMGHNLKDNEKLCSICLIKRMAFQVLKNETDHILRSAFKDKKNFPSTTYIALTNYFENMEQENKRILSKKEKNKISQDIHDSDDRTSDNHDRYYAVLMMDGDNMGKLVNGETLGSTWESIMHPQIVNRLKKESFEPKFRDNWKEIFDSGPHGIKQRLVTPAIHASISESLGDFSLYGVSGIIKKYKGTLIYAGGDDVCAVLPVETALLAAREIQKYYIGTFKIILKDKEPEDLTNSWLPVPGKLSVNLGKGEDISISAGILICHHKESLAEMIEESHFLLNEKAKTQAGRNACAIELRKRSGGSRYFIRKWTEEKAWEAFSTIGQAVKNKNKLQVSTSVVYRLEQLRNGVEAILNHGTDHDSQKAMLEKLILKQLDRSSVGDKEYQKNFASKMAEISLVKKYNSKINESKSEIKSKSESESESESKMNNDTKNNDDDNDDNKNRYDFKPEGLIVAAFMADRKEGGIK